MVTALQKTEKTFVPDYMTSGDGPGGISLFREESNTGISAQSDLPLA
jgi:hypothetical protein